MPEATRPLLKQIDALQHAMNGRTVAWEAVEARNASATANQRCAALHRSPGTCSTSLCRRASALTSDALASAGAVRCSLSQRLSEAEAGLAIATEREKSAQRSSASMKTQLAAAEEKVAIAG